MNNKILAVDDEQNLLDSLKRQLRKKFPIETALGPEEGLKAIAAHGPFAVILSDLRMPVMDGIQFLSRASEIAPDSVRIMLTGNADLQNAIHAVNKGNIYRFLTKPCATEILASVLGQGIEQYRLVTAEKELLEKTLKGSINVLTELLSMLNPEAFGRSSRIKRYVGEIARHLDITNVWQVETAAMLSQIGCVILPEEAIRKLYQGRELSGEDARLFNMHPTIASQLLAHIPRMQHVSEIIVYQEKHFDGSGNPKDLRQGEAIPLGARILKVVLDFDILESKGNLKGRALKELKHRSGWYDPAVLKALEHILGVDAKYVVKDVTINELKAHMILSEDVSTVKGQLVISRGQKVSPVLIERLNNFGGKMEIK
ncbi:MAG: HD domain-containing phosphohydrolase, partial [Thermodesulfobacteriota bacterium]|nr:HD domain-containing phosphohydrolase [Thermodesulfobacteriota bacterium]